MKKITVLIQLIFLLALLFLIPLIQADIFTRGKIIYNNTINNDREFGENKVREDGTGTPDADPGKVLTGFEYWDRDGRRHTGTYYPVSPGNVRRGVRYGANSAEFTGSYLHTTNITRTNIIVITNLTINNYFITTNLSITNFYITTNLFFFLRTGQISAYDPEDDGGLRNGFSRGYTNSNGSWNGSLRFTDNGDNTVTDNVTELMWTKNSSQTSQEWNTVLLSAKNCTVGGYTDWRLPNRLELESLLDMGRMSPALPAGHPFLNVSGNYWTSTTYAGGGAWYVNFSTGTTDNIDKSITYKGWYCRTR